MEVNHDEIRKEGEEVEDVLVEEEEGEGEDEDEEEQYVVLDLGPTAISRKAFTGGDYSLSGLDTENPILTLPNGVKMVGEYEEYPGTVLLLEEEADEDVDNSTFQTSSESNLATGVSHGSGVGEKGGEGSERALKKVKYFGKTSLKLKFTRA